MPVTPICCTSSLPMVFVHTDSCNLSRTNQAFSLSAGAPPHPTFFVRRSVYERYGAFDLRYKLAADAALMMRFLEVLRIRSAYVPRTWIHMASGGATNASWQNVVRQNREILHAATELGIRMPLVPFLYHKAFDRVRQRLRAGTLTLASAQ